jgi:hypothetical protein
VYLHGITSAAVHDLPEITPKPVATFAVKPDHRCMTDKPNISPGSDGMTTAAGGENRRLGRASKAKRITRFPQCALAVAAMVSMSLLFPGGQSEALAAPGDTDRSVMAPADDPLPDGLGLSDPPPDSILVIKVEYDTYIDGILVDRHTVLKPCPDCIIPWPWPFVKGVS